MKMKEALILTYNRFPVGDAGSVRQEAFSKLLMMNGYNVTILGMGDFTGPYINMYKDIAYMSFRSKGNSLLNRIYNIIGYKSKLKTYLKNNNSVDLIMIVQIPISAFVYIRKYAKENNILLLHDSVEWYSYEQFYLKKLSPSYILKDLYNRKLIDKTFKVVSISSLLHNHFESRGILSALVPVIMDARDICYAKNIDEGFLNFLYAGSPGKKDYLNEIIKGFCILPEEKLNKIKIRLLGVTKAQLHKIGVCEEQIDYLGSSLIIIGRVPRNEVLEALKVSDFTVLLRPCNLRYANAGFPTKVVESLMTATPVICNITSDLGEYIKDMENGIIVESNSADSFADAVTKAINLTLTERKNMQHNARISAEIHFDYKKHSEKIGIFLNNGDEN